jgi:hypothetical protein
MILSGENHFQRRLAGRERRGRRDHSSISSSVTRRFRFGFRMHRKLRASTVAVQDGGFLAIGIDDEIDLVTLPFLEI